MKKRFVSFLLMLVLILCFSVTAHAAVTAGLIYDETEQLITEDMEMLGNEYYYLIVDETLIAPYMDIYTGIGNMASVKEAAEYVYTQSGFGYGENKCGVLLALHVVPDGDSWTLNADAPYSLYCSNLPEGLEEVILAEIAPYMTPEAWAGDLEYDRIIAEGIAATFGNAIMNFDPNAEKAVEEAVQESVAEEAPVAETYTRYTPFKGEYLIDDYGLLTESEQAEIEAMAKRTSQKYGCGVYVMLVDDFTQLNGNTDIFKANYTYYHDNNMGEGRDGIFLLLSMGARDFSFFVYGEKAEYAFDSWGQQALEAEFIDDLIEDSWYDGVEDFVETCDEFLELAAKGEPVRENPMGKIALSTVISSFIALLTSAGLWNRNKGAKKKTSAFGYISGTLVPGAREDIFLNTTISRRIIQDSSDDSRSSSGSSSVSRSGGGGSGRSGKF